MSTNNNPTPSVSLDALAVGRSSTNPFLTVFETRDPTTGDVNYPIQQRWFNTTKDAEWILIGFSVISEVKTAIWRLISNSSADTETLTGNTGGAVGVDGANNINVLGDTTTINIAGNPATHTLTVSTAGSIANIYKGDTGSATPSGGVINFIANVISGSSPNFQASGSTLDLFLSDTNSNLILGYHSGNGSISGGGNTILGVVSGAGLTTGMYNIAVGYAALNSVTTGSGNAAIGQGSLNLTTGSGNLGFGFDSLNALIAGNNNIAVGNQAGTGYVASESSNIVIGNPGIASESNVIRVGTQGAGSGQQNKCFVAGINGNTVSNPAYVTINTATNQLGTTANSAFITIKNQVFTTTGTYTPTANMVYCSIQCLGGGAAGGGGPTTTNAQCAAGSGGGGGEYASGIFSAAAIGASQAITIGAAGIGVVNANGGNGGNTSVGALISAFGGSGGIVGAAVTTCAVFDGGNGGTGGSGGDYRTPGSVGGWSLAFLISPGFVSVGGVGAPSQLGAGGNVQTGTGLAGLGFGSGGGGASNIPGTAATTAGGNGAPGIVIITEYIA